MKRRFIASIFMVFIVASMFAGCSSEEKGNIRGSYYRLENNHNNYYIKIYSSGRVNCKNVYLGVLLGSQGCYLTGEGTGEASQYKTTTQAAYYHLKLKTKNYKVRNYKGTIIDDGEILGKSLFSASLSKDCKVITRNSMKYKK